MEKFISDEDELREEIDKMISITAMEEMKQIFPKETQKIMEEGMEKVD